jgi:hypothetical protein
VVNVHDPNSATLCRQLVMQLTLQLTSLGTIAQVMLLASVTTAMVQLSSVVFSVFYRYPLRHEALVVV